MNFSLSVIVICIIICVFTIILEYRRENRNWLAGRIMVSLMAIIALACIALPITYQGKGLTTGDNTAALLTANCSPDSLKLYKQIYTLDKDIKNVYPKAKLLTSLQDLNDIHPRIKQLHILGYGLNTADLRQLKDLDVVYRSPAIPTGVQSVNWPQLLKAGDLLQVQGRYNNTKAKPIKLQLKGLNTALDSVIVPAGKITVFELNTTPKIVGRAAYALLALDGKDTIEKENIPVAVEPAKPVKVLMLSASPDFESKFLKNWLAGNGYAVAARATISKEKSSQDFVNIPQQSLDHITPALLTKFDVVIGDLSTLKALSPAESSALKQQVEQNGLGVIVRADSSEKTSSWLQNNFTVSTLSTKSVTVQLSLKGQNGKTASLNIDPTYILDRNNIQNLVFDSQNHIVASSTISGAGRLAFTTLRTTYTWMLNGSTKDYTALWSLLINKVSHETAPVNNWTADSPITEIGEPVSLSLQNGTNPGKLLVNGADVAVMQNPLMPFKWDAEYRPAHAGWQQAKSGVEAPSWWYAYPANSWEPIRDLQKTNETKIFAEKISKLQTVTKQIQQPVTIEVPKMYFYLLLLASCSFLWVERKLNA